jgi:hypothetical protein
MANTIAVAAQMLRGFADGLRRLTAHNLPYNSLSTVRGQTGILVHVHPVLPWNPKSQQSQLLRSEPDGQPTDSSHLAGRLSLTLELAGLVTAIHHQKWTPVKGPDQSATATGQVRPI